MNKSSPTNKSFADTVVPSRRTRWSTVVVVAMFLVGTASATDTPLSALPKLIPGGSARAYISAQAKGATEDAPSRERHPPVLDRRDRIFYPGDTERLKPLGRKLVLNILLDQKAIFTSPFHINRQTAKWWLLSGATTAGLIAADHHIANSLENSRGQVRWGGRISRIGASYTLVPIVAAYYGYGVWRDHAKAREIGVLGTESLLDALIVAGILKEATRRNRPDEKDPGKFWGGGTSFPSGHAMQMWSIASLVSHEYKRNTMVQIAAYSLAGVVSASRIAAERHFASDVVTGGAIGWLIGRYVYDTHMSHLAHKHSSLIPMIVPQAQPSLRAYSVTVVFGGASPMISNGLTRMPVTGALLTNLPRH